MKGTRLRPVIVVVLLSAFAVFGCKKTVHYNPVPVTGYFMPMQVGKFITYRLDSLTFYYFGQSDTVNSYLAKDSVESSYKDINGSTIWVINRYLNDTSGAGFWNLTESYTVVTSISSVDVVENNLRFRKLIFPIEDGLSWNGNTFLPDAPFQDLFPFNYEINTKLQPPSWNYVYSNTYKPATILNKTYDSTVTIQQVDDSSRVPIVIDTLSASRTFWSETYAKNIGLIYRQTIMWEYQPAVNGNLGYKIGFGIKLSIVDHN